jgi:hypothetical protein
MKLVVMTNVLKTAAEIKPRDILVMVQSVQPVWQISKNVFKKLRKDKWENKEMQKIKFL